MKFSRCLLSIFIGIGLLSVCKPPKGKVGDRWINPIDGMTFTWIPSGSMEFEFPFDSAGETHYRRDEIIITEGFWMGVMEVTVKQYQNFANSTGYVTDAEKEYNRFTWKKPGFYQSEDHPVVYVSIDDAQSYANWAGVDIPFEEEWIYASKAGTNTHFFWGDSLEAEYVWYRENSVTGTQPVGRKLTNPWGLYDVIGNVWEYARIYDCDVIFTKLGASWTRCDRARGWWGPVYGNVLRSSADPKITNCEKTIYAPYPFDDDSGMRLIRRSKPYIRSSKTVF